MGSHGFGRSAVVDRGGIRADTSRYRRGYPERLRLAGSRPRRGARLHGITRDAPLVPPHFERHVLWGGPSDTLGINFDSASRAYRDALVGAGHFTVNCVHDKGHVMPPIAAPSDGSTKFKPLWQFLLDHPYGVTSPYETSGLPVGFPSWCAK